jgi:hypothetical protein
VVFGGRVPHAYLGCNARQVPAGIAASDSPVGCRLRFAGYEVAGLWLFTAVVVGVIVGLSRGMSRGRRRVAGSGESSLMRMVGFAAVVGLAAPAAAAVAYLVGLAIGRAQRSPCGVAIAQVLPVGLRPGRRDEALDVYRHLLAGGQLPRIRSSDFLGSDLVHMDTEMRYARYYAVPVYARRGWTPAYGAPRSFWPRS